MRSALWWTMPEPRNTVSTWLSHLPVRGVKTTVARHGRRGSRSALQRSRRLSPSGSVGGATDLAQSSRAGCGKRQKVWMFVSSPGLPLHAARPASNERQPRCPCASLSRDQRRSVELRRAQALASPGSARAERPFGQAGAFRAATIDDARRQRAQSTHTPVVSQRSLCIEGAEGRHRDAGADDVEITCSFGEKSMTRHYPVAPVTIPILTVGAGSGFGAARGRRSAQRV